jgi:DNA-binding NarL/FixJ family response regulator
MEDGHAAYRETIAAALRYLRPDLEVSSARTPELYDEVAREAPHVVICDRAVPELPGAWLSWVYLSLAPDRSSTVSVRGLRSETINPGLDGLLSAIGRTEKALAADPEERETAR